MRQPHLEKQQSEDGIALIFALTILALLLVMAIAFTSNSMMSSKAAQNSSYATASRLFTQSVLHQTEKMVAVYNDKLRCSKGLIDTPAGANKTTSDMLDHLTTYDDTVPLFIWKDSFKSYISWQYIKNGSNLVGRYAFVILPAYGLDANELAISGTDENGYNEVRIGDTYDEMNLRSINDSDITSGIADLFNIIGTGGGTQPVTGWSDFPTMFDSIHLNITDSLLRSKMMKWLTIGGSERAEKIWFDVNADKYQDSGDKYYHRFNIAGRSDNDADLSGGYSYGDTSVWNKLGNSYPPRMYKEILLDNDGDGVPDQEPKTYSSTPGTYDGYGLPWLAFAGYKSNGTIDVNWGGTFGKNAAGVIARRRQIAANLVDYCDDDYDTISHKYKHTPTSDVDPANWTNTALTAPTFTGNEGADISELTIEAKYQATDNGSGGIDGLISLFFGGEFNLLCQSFPASPWMFIVKGEYSTDGSTWTSFSKTIYITLASVTYQSGDSSSSYIPITKTVPGSSITLDVQVKIDRVVLRNQILGVNVDLANFKKAVTIDLGNQTLSDGNILFLCKDLSVKDPRQNLNAWTEDSDWYYKADQFPVGVGGSMAAARTAAHATLGNVNQGVSVTYSPAAWHAAHPNSSDAEIATDHQTRYDDSVNGISTAYIRNAAMLTPWEIGFISRGAPYQTINLTKYDENKGETIKIPGTPPPAVILPGCGDYANGDANILDQIKIDHEVKNPKVNINNQYIDSDGKNFVLRTLLDKIHVNCLADSSMSKSSLATTGSVVANLDDLAGAITNRGTDVDYLTRAAVANCTKPGSSTRALSDGSCGVNQNTNATQEELIGKFINLTEVSGQSDLFTAIILAQTIKDVGGSVPIKLKDGSTVTTKFGQFDYHYDTVSKKYYYADQITSEQKIKVLFKVNSSGNCQVIRYEYVD